jgi:hypothetical protein
VDPRFSLVDDDDGDEKERGKKKGKGVPVADHGHP